MKLLLASFMLLHIGRAQQRETPAPVNARVILSGNSNVTGVLNMKQEEVVDDSGAARLQVTITGQIMGLTPGNHGFHVHQLGDVYTNGCDSTGPHFNPDKHVHGAPHDEVRHAGDLGNILADNNGVATINIKDRVVSLGSTNSILGRAIVVHAAEDDLGKGGNDGSTKTGNAGARLACGIIFLAA